jgi:predicted Holliday junction resolvase-like endonuclease
VEYYDVNVLIVRKKDEIETYTEEYDMEVEFKDDAEYEEIQTKISELIDSEIRKSKDIMLFGSVTITMSDSHQLVMNFKNKDELNIDADEIFDLLLTSEETMN